MFCYSIFRSPLLNRLYSEATLRCILARQLFNTVVSKDPNNKEREELCTNKNTPGNSTEAGSKLSTQKWGKSNKYSTRNQA